MNSRGAAGDVPAGITLSNWLSPPFSQWSFQHVEDFVPTALISRGTATIAPLPPGPSSELASIAVPAARGGDTTVGEIMDATATDGWAVAHRGSLVCEDYRGTMAADTRHLLFSVSKSMVATVVGALYAANALEIDAPVTRYVPALDNCGYSGATVRHLLDMRSGIAFSDNYLHPTAEVHVLDEAMGWAPRVSTNSPATLYDFLLTLRQKSPHGGAFEYRSCETDVLGWICEAATGQRMPELMSELLWGRIGAHHDASIGVDPSGTGFFDGGISACLCDLIRFGSLFLRDGVSLTGQQVVPATWIADTLAGGPDSRAAFAAGPDDAMPGGMYRNQMWFPYPGHTVLLCLGMCGQMIYINRGADVVGAKLSTQSFAADSQMLADTLRAFDAISGALAG